MADAVIAGFAALNPCVHCGFCLPACPTYLATGDEADSPRGRIVLMRALERREIPPTDASLIQHLEACLGCRGCEPVCPSGVGYGLGLEAARARLFSARGLPYLARLTLWVFASSSRWRPILGSARMVRDSGLARRLAGRGRLGFGMGMLAASRGRGAEGRTDGERPPSWACSPSWPASREMENRPTVALFRGCVMDALFGHVHAATRRTLEANGYRVLEIQGQTCCGALHDHAGDREAAAFLAEVNVGAFAGRATFIAVNSAGCGAALKDYGRLLGTSEATEFATRVRDVTELLADRGPRAGDRLELDVAYDAPCHLQHAQRVQDQPLAVLGAIPGIRLRLLPGSDRCCGSAGIYSLIQPGLSRMVLQAKLEALADAEPRPQIVATGNPGCLMQIGAGCLAAGLSIEPRHPVELLDWSYRSAGLYS